MQRIIIYTGTYVIVLVKCVQYNMHKLPVRVNKDPSLKTLKIFKFIPIIRLMFDIIMFTADTSINKSVQ